MADVFSSQRNRDLMSYVINVMIASTEESVSVLVDCPEYHGQETFRWRFKQAGLKVIYRDVVHTLQPKEYPYTGMAEAKKETALSFWETYLLTLFLRKSIAITARARRNISLEAKKIALSFQNNSGFPPGFLAEAEMLLPESIERCDWDGARERIMGRWPTDGVLPSSKTDKK